MFRIYYLETKFEFLSLLRMPSYAASTILFPLLFYVFFALVLPTRPIGPGVPMAQYLLGTYGACGVIAATLFALGAGVAAERGQGWLLVKRASPMPLAAWLVAKSAGATAFAAIVLVLLFSLGAGFGGVTLTPREWGLGVVTLLLGSIPFGFLGLLIGMLARPNAAPGMVNLVFLPMCLVSGLWIPLAMLPPKVAAVAAYLPSYHLGQLGLAALGVTPQAAPAQHALILGGYGVVFAGLAWFSYIRQQEKL
jgi:ABC-2 type transport system permease protein